MPRERRFLKGDESSMRHDDRLPSFCRTVGEEDLVYLARSFLRPSASA